MTDTDKGAILDELIAMRSVGEIEADEWTVGDYAERAGCTYTRAQREVEILMGKGLVTRRRAVATGRRVWAYKKA